MRKITPIFIRRNQKFFSPKSPAYTRCLMTLHQTGNRPKGQGQHALLHHCITVQKQKLISQCLIMIQHTMICQSRIPCSKRGQYNFPCSKLCCYYIFIVLKYWWQNSITAHIYANCDQGIVTR